MSRRHSSFHASTIYFVTLLFILFWFCSPTLGYFAQRPSTSCQLQTCHSTLGHFPLFLAPLLCISRNRHQVSTWVIAYHRATRCSPTPFPDSCIVARNATLASIPQHTAITHSPQRTANQSSLHSRPNTSACWKYSGNFCASISCIYKARSIATLYAMNSLTLAYNPLDYEPH